MNDVNKFKVGGSLLHNVRQIQKEPIKVLKNFKNGNTNVIIVKNGLWKKKYKLTI